MIESALCRVEPCSTHARSAKSSRAWARFYSRSTPCVDVWIKFHTFKCGVDERRDMGSEPFAMQRDPTRLRRGVAHGGADPALHHAIGQRGLLVQQALGQVMHAGQQAGVARKISDAETGQAGLAGAE